MEPISGKIEWKIYRFPKCECVIAGYAPQVEQIKLCFMHEMLIEELKKNAPNTFKKLMDEIKKVI